MTVYKCDRCATITEKTNHLTKVAIEIISMSHPSKVTILELCNDCLSVFNYHQNNFISFGKGLKE